MITIRQHDGVETRFDLVADDHGMLWIKNGPHRRHVLCHALRELGWSIIAADPPDQVRLDAAGFVVEAPGKERATAKTTTTGAAETYIALRLVRSPVSAT